MSGDIEVNYHKGAKRFRRWHVIVHGTGERIGIYRRRDIAYAVCTAVARERAVEAFYKNRRNVIVNRSSFGNDPVGRG